MYTTLYTRDSLMNAGLVIWLCTGMYDASITSALQLLQTSSTFPPSLSCLGLGALCPRFAVHLSPSSSWPNVQCLTNEPRSCWAVPVMATASHQGHGGNGIAPAARSCWPIHYLRSNGSYFSSLGRDKWPHSKSPVQGAETQLMYGWVPLINAPHQSACDADSSPQWGLC